MLALIVIPTLAFPLPIQLAVNWLHGITVAAFSTLLVWLLLIALLLCAASALWPRIGHLKLGLANDKPEFSLFAWITMLYGAGVSAALINWSVAEPLHFLQENPDNILGTATIGTAENFRMALKWAFVHWGISAWACYAITGLGLAFTCYRQGKPLGISTALTPILGNTWAQASGGFLNIITLVVGMLCLWNILSLGIEQVRSNFLWLGMNTATLPVDPAAFVPLVVVIVVVVSSVACISSGPARGIKWMSIINVALSAILLVSLLGATSFSGLTIFFVCLTDYFVALPVLLTSVWRGNDLPASVPSQLQNWQQQWSFFHWTWWIPFTVFIGYFMARISRGRTVREFVLAAMLAPAFMCFSWLAWAGGTGMQLETTAVRGIELGSVADADKLLAIIQHLFTPIPSIFLLALTFCLIGTYMITSVASALFVIGSVSASGEVARSTRSQFMLWAVVLAAVTLCIDYFSAAAALQVIMCLSAVPVSLLVALLCGSFIKGVYMELGAKPARPPL